MRGWIALPLESHRPARPRPRGRAPSAKEIVPLTIDGGRHTEDEGIRFDASLQSIGSVKLLKEDGVITAANASQICDGASAALIVGEKALKDHKIRPIARIVLAA